MLMNRLERPLLSRLVLLKTKLRQTVLFASALVFGLISFSPTAVSALSADNLHSIYNDSVWYRTGGSLACDLGGPVENTLPPTVPEPYRTIFTQAAAAYNANVQLLT